METRASDGQLIARYLLGALSEAEQVQIEDRAFSDREFRRNIEEAENDLIDDYVRGALAESERRQFERMFLAAAERQKKVEFARALARVVPTTEAMAPAVTTRWREALLAFLRGLNPALRFSMAAAALLLIVGVVWLFTLTRELRTQVAQLQARQQSQQQQEEILRRQAASERARSEDLMAQLEDERAHSKQLAQQIERDKSQAGSSALPPVLSLFLPPVVGRGDEKRPQLVQPPAAQIVRLQIGLEREDNFKSYRVEIGPLQGPAILTRDRLRPQGRHLSVTVPSRLLHAGQYEITLKGATEAQQFEVVRYYYFDVLKK